MREEGSAGSFDVNLGDHHRLVPAVPSYSLVWPNLIETFSLGNPSASSILEDRRGMPRCYLIERARLKVDADKGQEMASLPVPRPEDFVVPPCFDPPRAFRGIDPVQSGDETGLQPFAAVMEGFTRLVYVEIFKEEPEGALQDEKGRSQADGQNSSPYQPTHVQAPGHIPGFVNG
jgi:hypothetical protein